MSKKLKLDVAKDIRAKQGVKPKSVDSKDHPLFHTLIHKVFWRKILRTPSHKRSSPKYLEKVTSRVTPFLVDSEITILNIVKQWPLHTGQFQYARCQILPSSNWPFNLSSLLAHKSTFQS